MKIVSAEYKNWLKDLKDRFQQAQIKAAVRVNSTLIEFYWNLGAEIIEKEKTATWGSGFLKQLSKDLVTEFPDIKGFSYENLRYVKRWFLFYTKEDAKMGTTCSQNEKWEQPVPYPELFSIPWGHNLVIISKCSTVEEALFYVRNTTQYGWSRSVLTLQIESNLYTREGKAITNFETHLPAADSDLAQQVIKDPYNFEFVTLTKDFKERELEKGLMEHTEKFLLELGQGFAFVGRQYKLPLSDKEFYCDLLFYHLELRCFVVIDLKTGGFMPEYAGKMNFYCNIVDDQLRKEGDAPTIGMILCKSKDKVIVEYALKRVDAPMGVSEYQITEALPDELKSALPSVEEIEAELGGADE